MVVDTSALLAILFAEVEAESFTRLIMSEPSRRMSAMNFTEAAVVADGNPTKLTAGATLDELIRQLGLTIAAVTPEHAAMAREAYRRFGRGNHPARLNLGGCFAYALSRLSSEPLLFKGEDFRLTDATTAA